MLYADKNNLTLSNLSLMSAPLQIAGVEMGTDTQDWLHWDSRCCLKLHLSSVMILQHSRSIISGSTQSALFTCRKKSTYRWWIFDWIMNVYTVVFLFKQGVGKRKFLAEIKHCLIYSFILGRVKSCLNWTCLNQKTTVLVLIGRVS